MISPKYFREISQRYRLEAGKCNGCGTAYFPPRLICPECKSKDFTKINLNSEGTLLTYTVVRVGSDKFSQQSPFAVGIVELNDGVKITAQLADVDFEHLKIGLKVKMVFRKVQDEGKSGLHCYGYKAILI